jgi:hypothetical protein
MFGSLGANKRRHDLDGGSVRLRLLQRGKDFRLDELGNLHRVARCDGKGVLRTEN